MLAPKCDVVVHRVVSGGEGAGVLAVGRWLMPAPRASPGSWLARMIGACFYCTPALGHR
jgi:hypothetical protein